MQNTGGIETYIGAMPAHVLTQHKYVPQMNPIKETGYQRRLSDIRVSQLARGIRDGKVDLPTAVLLSIRGVHKDDVIHREASDIYTLELDAELCDTLHRLYVVDGQHRLAALEKASETTDVSKIKVPFILMIGTNEQQEMEQFYLVNKHAKSVPTDLAYEILTASSTASSPSFVEMHISKRGKWEIEAQQLVHLLYEGSLNWKEGIKLANMTGGNLVPAGTFIKSLQSFMDMVILSRVTLEQKKQILDAYWSAIHRIYPEIQENRNDYTLHKGLGVFVMHQIFRVVSDHVRSAGNSLYKPDGYVEVMEHALQRIEGFNGSGEAVMGQGFWLRGNKGASGVFSSGAGRDRLVKLLLALLPELDLN